MITQNNNPKGFSLVELSVSLIVISLLTASFAPVITKKLSKNNITVGSFGGGGGGGGASLECSGISDCILCKDNICYTCIKNKETCATGTYLDNPSCSCKPCSDIMAGCTSCTKGGVCTSSTACSIFGDYCIQCSVAECEQCRTGYNLNEEKTACLPDKIDCNDPNCATCLTQADKCDVCNGGYEEEGGECVTARLVDYTFKDSSGNDIKTTGTALAQSGNEWKIKIIKSGTITFTKLYSLVDVFVVGAGGAGGNGGGGGGYTKTERNVVINIDENYRITIGAGTSSRGGTTSGFGIYAGGGWKGQNLGNGHPEGGGGGSGGSGYNGSCVGGTNGANGSGSSGYGQGTTTREFEEDAVGTFAGEPKGTLYSTGGGGGTCTSTAGQANTGNGGTKANGGSGIVIVRGYGPIDSNQECKIRNCATCVSGNNYACKTCAKGYTVQGSSCVVNPPVIYTYTNKDTGSVLSMDGTKWKIKFTQSGTFNPSKVPGTGSIQIFAVGGGGTGGNGGGGGGYTKTSGGTILKNNDYPITVADSGNTTIAFGVAASPGSAGPATGGGNTTNAGNGGSGGAKYQNCSPGKDGGSAAGVGQGSTTREFGLLSGYLYSTGGLGGGCGTQAGQRGNTGDGGSSTNGDSGIVVIKGEY